MRQYARKILSRENLLLPVSLVERPQDRSTTQRSGATARRQPENHISRGAVTGQRALSCADLLTLQSQVGNRATGRLLRASASLQPTIQRKLKQDPEFGEVDQYGRGGTSMKATFVPGPSTPGNEQTVPPPIFVRYPKAREGVGSLYKLGHLLNARLGGDGRDPRNIAILTSSANTTHYHQVEKWIIEREKTLKAGEELTYEVKVVYPGVPSHEGPNVFEAQLAVALVASSNEPILGRKQETKKLRQDVLQAPPHFEPGAAAAAGPPAYEPSNDLAELFSGVRHWTELPPELNEFKDVEKMFLTHAPRTHGLDALTAGIRMVEEADEGKRPLFSYKPPDPAGEKAKAASWAAHIRHQAKGFATIFSALTAMKSEVLAAKAKAMYHRYDQIAEEVERYA